MKSRRKCSNYIVIVHAVHSSKGLFCVAISLGDTMSDCTCVCMCVCIGENYGLAVRHCQGAH